MSQRVQKPLMWSCSKAALRRRTLIVLGVIRATTSHRRLNYCATKDYIESRGSGSRGCCMKLSDYNVSGCFKSETQRYLPPVTCCFLELGTVLLEDQRRAF